MTLRLVLADDSILLREGLARLVEQRYEALGDHTFEINGVRFGYAICLEVRFPEVFDEYRRLGAQCVLISSFTAARNDKVDAKQDDIFAITAQAHAANNCYWVSLVTPSNRFQGPVTQLIDPLGSVAARSRRHRADLAIGRIDVGEGSLWHGIEFGRAWRETARSGAIWRRSSSMPRKEHGHSAPAWRWKNMFRPPSFRCSTVFTQSSAP